MRETFKPRSVGGSLGNNRFYLTAGCYCRRLPYVVPAKEKYKKTLIVKTYINMIENTEKIISLGEESEDTNRKNPEPDLLIMQHNRKIKYWVDISQYDLETADVMMKGKRFLYVGFMCHQTVEKILKAFYVFVKKDNPPYIHNIKRIY